MTNPESMNIGGGGGDGTSFQFDAIGAVVTGLITSMQTLQQTDLQKREPKTFADGSPMMMYAVTLATELRDSAGLSEPLANDTGLRVVYLKGSKKPESQSSLAAVLGAVKSVTGGSDLKVGGKLTLQYTGDGEKKLGYTPAKKYAAAYEAPSMSLGSVAAPAVVATGFIPTTPPAPIVTAPPIAAAPSPDAQIAQLRAAGMTDEQLRGIGFDIPAAAPVTLADPIALHPQGPPLRAAGLSDEQIRAALGIPA